MAQSHIKLTGGIGDGKVIQNTISQLSHGFSVGQAIRYNRIAATGTGTNKYEAALADSPENSEVVGIVTQVLGDSSFVLTYAGEVDISTFGGVFALDDDDVFFLSDETPGLLTNTPPSDAGSIIKPVLIRTDGTRGVLTNYIGTVIGGTSVVSLNGIQPVGTIEPFAGLAASVPETWSLCDGGALSIDDYPDLFTQIGKAFGYHIKVEGSGSFSNVQVGHYVEFRNGESLLLSGRVAETSASYFVVDVNYLEIVSDVYVQHDIDPPTGPGSKVVIPISDTTTLNHYGSVVAAAAAGQPTTAIAITDITLTNVNFRKPDLRGKVVLGLAEANVGTAISSPNNIVRGEIGGEYVATTGSGVAGNIATDGSGSISTIPPYQGLNWIIKTSSLGKAALLDNLTANFKLSDLLDVNAPPETAQSGQVLVYDAASPIGERYRPYRLFLDFPDDAGNVFQIDNSGSKPLVKFGDSSLTSAFGINLDGLGSGTNPEFTIKANNQTVFAVQKDGIDGARVGVGVPAEAGVNLKIGSKRLKFSAGNDPTIKRVKTTINNTGSDDALVTEKGIRDAIRAAVGFSSLSVVAKNTNTTPDLGKAIPIWVVNSTDSTGNYTLPGTDSVKYFVFLLGKFNYDGGSGEDVGLADVGIRTGGHIVKPGTGEIPQPSGFSQTTPTNRYAIGFAIRIQ